MKDLAPNDTGTLAEAVSEIGPAKKTELGWSIGVGNLGRLGDPSAQTKGTLMAFFDDYEQFTPTIWRNLPKNAKDLLAEGRRQGLYGGPMYTTGAPAKYYYVQEGGRWAGSSAAAHVSPHEFTQSSLDEWRGQLNGMIGEILDSR